MILSCIVLTLSSQYVRALAEEPSKPTGFSGYLLDTRGFAEEKREPAWKETFESPGISWRYLYQDGSVKIETHRRVHQEAHGDERSEYIKYEVEEPGVIVFGHYVDYPSVYNETDPTVWVRSDRPGVSLAALVVFPKTKRPDTGAPLTALAVGSSYEKPGEWQKLRFPDGLVKSLEDAVQAIRGEHKLPVDSSCAYIRQIVLLTEARYGRYQLWIDDLTISEHIRPSAELLQASERFARFDPINLLSSRLQLSQTPIFWQDTAEQTDIYGTEPFAIDESKIESNKYKLKFGSPALSTLVSGENILAFSTDSKSSSTNGSPRSTSRGFGSAFNSVGEPTYQESSLFLPLDDGILSGFETTLAQSASSKERSISSALAPSLKVGQTGFVDEATSSHMVSQAAFGSSENSSDLSLDAQYSAMHPVDYLISGSGTLNDATSAAEYGFFHKGEKLTANVYVHESGNLTSDGQKLYSIRAIEYNGEPFEYLKGLGFNAIWLRETPTSETLAKANEVGIWLIAQPPLGVELVSSSNANALSNQNEYFGGAPVDSVYDPVLMWDLGKRLRRDQVEVNRSKIETIKKLDPYHRPIVASIYNGVSEYTSGSKLDVILLDREPLLSSLDMNDYGEWLLNYSNLFATPKAAALWNQIQTQPSYSSSQQRQYFGMVNETPGVVSYEQMRQSVRFSMRAGCRGLLFTSTSRLDAKDHKTQYRSTALEALNLEIQFLTTWFALGRADKTIRKTSSPDLGALVLKAHRASLVAPISCAANNQYVMGQDAVNNWSATISTPESYSPDLLTPGALRKILAKRRAGGSSFTLDEGSMNTLLFFTQSDSLSQKATEQALAFGKRSAELAINLARKRLDLYEQTVYQLRCLKEHGSTKRSPEPPLLGPVLDRAYEKLEDAEQSLRRHDASQAYLTAERATREVRQIERDFWTEATSTEIARPVTPLSTSFYDMPVYLELYEKLVSGKLRSSGPNLIRGGDMESPSTAMGDGWQTYLDTSIGLTGEVYYNAKSKHTGQFGLNVIVHPQVANQPPAEAECPAIFLEVGFDTHVGQLICIQGWIKIPEDLTNSVDGVTIYDDQGGESLALRFKKACGWKRFAFYRISTNDGPMRVRFAFSGVGEVYLDDVAAYVIQ